MKRFILFFLLLTISSGLVKGQTAPQTYWPSSIPPKSNSYSGTTRVDTTSGVVDSIRNHYFSYNNKWNLYYTATQSNLRFLKLTSNASQAVTGTMNVSGYPFSAVEFKPSVSTTTPGVHAYGVFFNNFGTASGGGGAARYAVGFGAAGFEDQGPASFDTLVKANKFQINQGVSEPGIYHIFAWQDTSGVQIGYMGASAFRWNKELIFTGLSSGTPASNSYLTLDASGNVILAPGSEDEGILSLNGLFTNSQILATGTIGTDFGISSSGNTHTFNLPTASATNRGALSSSDWLRFNSSVAYVATISAMQSYIGTANVIDVTDPLRGGIFTLVNGSYTADGGITFAATGLGGSNYWVRQNVGSLIRPEWWGALGNGTNDDATYINDAIVAANALGGMHTVFLSAFSYGFGSTIIMKKGTTLAGPVGQYANINDVNSIKDLSTQTHLNALSGLTGDGIKYDFTTDSARMPYNASVQNLDINMNGYGTYGLHFIQPSSGWGPQGDGVIQGGIHISYVFVMNGTTAGIYNEPNVNGVYFNTVYSAQNAGYGWDLRATDTFLSFCAGYQNGAANLHSMGNSMRIDNCDFFKGATNDLYDEGFENNYNKCQFNNCKLDNILIATGTTYANAGRNNVFINCRIYGGGSQTDNTYADVNIKSYSGTAIATAFIGCEFSLSSINANKPAYSITAANAGMIKLNGNNFQTAGLSSSATANLNSTVWQNALMDRSNNIGGTFVGNQAIALPAGTTTIAATNGTVFSTANTSATTIGNITGGKTGQWLDLIVTDANTLINCTGNLHGGNGTSAMLCQTGQLIHFVCVDGTAWYFSVSANQIVNNMTTKTVSPATSFTGTLGTSTNIYNALYVNKITNNAVYNKIAGTTADSVLVASGTSGKMAAKVLATSFAGKISQTSTSLTFGPDTTTATGLSGKYLPLSYVTATQSSSTNMVPNWAGVTNYAAPINNPIFTTGATSPIFYATTIPSTISGSTSGAAQFTEPEAGTAYKKVLIYLSALNGTATWSFTTAFSHTPVVINTNGLATTLVTSLSTSSVTVTGSTSTGFLIIEGW